MKDKLPTVPRKQGRPPKYADDELELFQQRIHTYFTECDQKEQAYTTYDLALALGISRDALWRYGEDSEGDDEQGLRRQGFRDAVKDAKARIRSQAERLLLSGKATIGAIFWLKNCAGWKDQQEQAFNTGIQVVIDGSIIAACKSQDKSEALPASYGPAMLTIDVGRPTDSVSVAQDEDADEER